MTKDEIPFPIKIQIQLCKDEKLNAKCEGCDYREMNCHPTTLGKSKLISLLNLDLTELKKYYCWLKSNIIDSHKLKFSKNREFQEDILQTRDRIVKDFDIIKERNCFEGYVGDSIGWLEESLKSVASLIQVFTDLKSNIIEGKPTVCSLSICDELIREKDKYYTCSLCKKIYCKDHAQEFLFTIICDECLDKGCNLCDKKYDDLEGVVHDSRFVKCQARTCNIMACHSCWEVCATCGGVFCHHHILYCEECENWTCDECRCNCGDE
jgi:hypothetical protein